ncbi:uncharacterized protein LOC135499964 [Lineus longissimus]|uniref:uncharacterized protein LOC135494058 n=1 Tax=Lineus longissimus TaxID=88925 RepID=UPI00315D3C46
MAPVQSRLLFALAAGSAVAAMAAAVAYHKMKRRRTKRTVWVRKWIQRRKTRGSYAMLVDELRLEDPGSYKNYLRMDEETFEHLVQLVTPYVAREDTNMREAITPAERLAVTLRFLATGETFQSLQFSTRLSRSTIGAIIPETCCAIYETLKMDYIKVPSNEQEWLKVAEEFETKWNLPHCLGAMDGKHVVFRPPLRYGSYFYNYKGTHSIVLFALVDADYKFLMIDAGTNGRVGDGGVFRKSDLNNAMADGTIHFPEAKPLHDCDATMPYFFVADDAFPLQTDIMKPYPFRNLDKDKRVFNYRLSRARRVVENAFGILANRFRVFLAPILLSPEKVQMIILAACALHNFLRVHNSAKYFPPRAVDREQLNRGVVAKGDWRSVKKAEEAFQGIEHQSGNRYANDAQSQRDALRGYVNGIGRVAWQDRFCS